MESRKADSIERINSPSFWVPIHRGEYFCSPGCGAGCKIGAYNAAQERGKALAESLGPGWLSRVWENTGWFYCAVSECSRVRVDPALMSGYCAYVLGGRYHAFGDTPSEAVSAALKRIEVLRDELSSVLLVRYSEQVDTGPGIG